LRFISRLTPLLCNPSHWDGNDRDYDQQRPQREPKTTAAGWGGRTIHDDLLLI
jgi:hypothetical protein